ncbi:MAG: DNA repair protein RecO [Anaerolineae bacterium]|nr:DNA repair protein RecO [Anaerolineae bacterium]
MPSAERLFRTEAIILRRRDFGEADRLLTLFTPSRGKLGVLAKGARKPTSRKGGHVELFALVDMLVAKGRSLDIISQVEMIEPYRALRDDLVRTTYAAHIVELLDRFTGEGEENVNAYNLLKAALGYLCQEVDPRLVARFYELHLLTWVGYRPELFACVRGGEEIDAQDQYFSYADGGAVCPRHGGRSMTPVSLGALKVLRYLQTRDFAAVRGLTLRPETHAEVERVIHGYITYLLEQRLQSADFLRHLRRLAAQ